MSRKNVNKTVEISRVKQQGVELFVDGGNYIIIKTGNCSHQGAREYQEDSFGWSNIIDSKIISEKGFAAIVADGMGGLANGKDISDYVVSSFIQMFSGLNYDASFPPQLEKIVERINDEVCRNFSVNGQSGAGSTLVAIFVYKTKLYWVSVGDSRLYILRNNTLYAVNEDHDYFNQLLTDHMAGDITMQQIRTDKQKDTLASYIGNEKLPSVDANKKGFSVCKGDTLVLCSDGIYNGISDAEMANMLNIYEPQKASENIVQAVLNKSIAGQDNLTVMIIKLEG